MIDFRTCPFDGITRILHVPRKTWRTSWSMLPKRKTSVKQLPFRIRCTRCLLYTCYYRPFSVITAMFLSSSQSCEQIIALVTRPHTNRCNSNACRTSYAFCERIAGCEFLENGTPYANMGSVHIPRWIGENLQKLSSAWKGQEWQPIRKNEPISSSRH